MDQIYGRSTLSYSCLILAAAAAAVQRSPLAVHTCYDLRELRQQKGRTVTLRMYMGATKRLNAIAIVISKTRVTIVVQVQVGLPLRRLERPTINHSEPPQRRSATSGFLLRPSIPLFALVLMLSVLFVSYPLVHRRFPQCMDSDGTRTVRLLPREHV